MHNRVVISGIGLITSLAQSVGRLTDALAEGRSGIGTIERFSCEHLPVRIGGECVGFKPENEEIEAREARRMDRFAQFGVAASRFAMLDAGLDLASLGINPDRVGVMIGTGVGGLETIQNQHRTMLKRGYKKMSPFTVSNMMPNAATANVALRYGLTGISTCVSTACSTSANAIGDAYRAIQSGKADIMLAGGSEAALCELGLSSFIAARSLSTNNDAPAKASRPWDKDRDGFVLSEGAVVLVLEAIDNALARDARIYAELVGYGLNSDAHHITSPDPSGSRAAAAMRLALADAQVNPEQIPYVAAHATSTKLGDVAETQAIRQAFGMHASKLMVSSVKSQAGHLLGAAGALSVVTGSLALSERLIPATINLDDPGEDCDLDYVPNTPRDQSIDFVLVNSFGFGGHNTAVVLRKFN